MDTYRAQMRLHKFRSPQLQVIGNGVTVCLHFSTVESYMYMQKFWKKHTRGVFATQISNAVSDSVPP